MEEEKITEQEPENYVTEKRIPRNDPNWAHSALIPSLDKDTREAYSEQEIKAIDLVEDGYDEEYVKEVTGLSDEDYAQLKTDYYAKSKIDLVEDGYDEEFIKEVTGSRDYAQLKADYYAKSKRSR